ncbi:MAG: hypothetical protein M3332_02575 [Actinomycetota bacterium]|nr:hypothetical protein [Actinomycetota bacterium]
MVRTSYLVVDLAGMISCDHRLFDVLGWTHKILADQGRRRLVGIGPVVVNALASRVRRGVVTAPAALSPCPSTMGRNTMS